MRPVDADVADRIRRLAREAAEEAEVDGLRANGMRASDFQRLLLAMHAKGLRFAGFGSRGDGDKMEDLWPESVASDAEFPGEGIGTPGQAEGASEAAPASALGRQ